MPFLCASFLDDEALNSDPTAFFDRLLKADGDLRKKINLKISLYNGTHTTYELSTYHANWRKLQDVSLKRNTYALCVALDRATSINTTPKESLDFSGNVSTPIDSEFAIEISMDEEYRFNAQDTDNELEQLAMFRSDKGLPFATLELMVLETQHPFSTAIRQIFPTVAQNRQDPVTVACNVNTPTADDTFCDLAPEWDGRFACDIDTQATCANGQLEYADFPLVTDTDSPDVNAFIDALKINKPTCLDASRKKVDCHGSQINAEKMPLASYAIAQNDADDINKVQLLNHSDMSSRMLIRNNWRGVHKRQYCIPSTITTGNIDDLKSKHASLHRR